MADLFIKRAKQYSEGRSSYPQELFQFIASKTPSQDLVWDVGTRSGQAAASDGVGNEKWSRLHMPTNRYSTMTSNIVESVNAVTRASKNYPIQALLESLRKTIQSWFCKNRDNAHCTFTKLSTKYEKQLRKMSHDLRNLKVSPASHTLYEVRDDSSLFMIDIHERTCICRMFQVDLLPCPHALEVITTLKLDMYDFCSNYYTKDAYMNTYRSTVFPIRNIIEWNIPVELY